MLLPRVLELTTWLTKVFLCVLDSSVSGPVHGPVLVSLQLDCQALESSRTQAVELV